MIAKEVRARILAGMPNLIADGYDLPRTSVQLAIQRLADNITDLQRRGA